MLLTSLFLISCNSKKVDCRVAVAANMQFAFDELANDFEANTGLNVESSSASSGQLYAQISQGAPFDLFLSADTIYPFILANEGKAIGNQSIYARGQLILLSASKIDLSKGMEILKSPEIKHIAIAKPETAPYGFAAKTALVNAGIFDSIESKLVYGQSISQVNHLIQSNAVECGFTSASILNQMSDFDRFSFIKINQDLYPPLYQGMILIKQKENSQIEFAKAFFEYLQSPKAIQILEKHGFQF